MVKEAATQTAQKTEQLLINKGSRHADFIVGPNGVTMPTNRKVFESGLIDAGFPSYTTRRPGTGYILPNKNHVRIMEPSGPAPLRASFTHADGESLISPFTWKPVHPPKGMDSKLIKKYVIDGTHVELFYD